MKEFTIIGSGMSGLGAAYQLKAEGVSPSIYEAKEYVGGHTYSFSDPSGFIFDDGPHISFTKDERIQKIFADSVNQEYESFHATVNNYWQGHWITHPVQCNLHGLPAELLISIISDFVKAKPIDAENAKNYKEWLLGNMGTTCAETFPLAYTRKYHTTDAENMSTDWIGPRVYPPSLEEILRGALTPEPPDVHYVDGFRYPTHNGFVSYVDGLASNLDIQLNHKVVSIDARLRKLTFGNGNETRFKNLISSIPLPLLIPLIQDVPEKVKQAAGKLAWSNCVSINIGIDRADLSNAHWTYFYDDDIIFTRLSFPHMFSANNVPLGAGSIQAEIYRSDKYLPLTEKPEDLIEPVIRDLRRCGLIRDTDKILFSEARYTPHIDHKQLCLSHLGSR